MGSIGAAFLPRPPAKLSAAADRTLIEEVNENGGTAVATDWTLTVAGYAANNPRPPPTTVVAQVAGSYGIA